jgi:hypothetical protein
LYTIDPVRNSCEFLSFAVSCIFPTFTFRQTLVEDEDQETGADIPVIKFELEPQSSETKITNSPSSITTTTYSTHSTMGTVATDDEISEGEQLQVCETKILKCLFEKADLHYTTFA